MCAKSFDMKESFLPLNNMDPNMYSADRSDAHVSGLIFNKLHQNSLVGERYIDDIPLNNISGPILNFHAESVSPKFKIGEADIENKQLLANSSFQKRKFGEIGKDKKEFSNTNSTKFPKISDTIHLKKENYWEQYTSLKAFSLENYSSLLPSMHHKNSVLPESLSFSTPIDVGNPLEHINQGAEKAFHIEGIFTNAASKNINTEMLTAQNAIQSVLHSETRPKPDSEVESVSVRKTQSVDMPVFRNRVTSCPTRNYESDKITMGEIDSESFKNNHELGVNVDDIDSLSFSTAAGKTLDVSDAAVKAAQKLLQGAFENEDEVMPSTSVIYNTGRKKSAMKNIGCPSKKSLIEDSDNIDKPILENIFQNDAFFEENSQDSTELSKDRDFDKVSESKTNNDPTVRKIRKSLGGRRSMRFYSHK